MTTLIFLSDLYEGVYELGHSLYRPNGYTEKGAKQIGVKEYGTTSNQTHDQSQVDGGL